MNDLQISYREWAKEEIDNKLNSISKLKEEVKYLEYLDNLLLPLLPKEELLKTLNELNKFYNIPTSDFIEALLLGIPKIDNGNHYEIAGLVFSYDNFVNSSFIFSNQLEMNKFNRKLDNLFVKYNEELLEDQMESISNKKTIEYFENKSEVVKPESMLFKIKQHEIFMNIKLNGHKDLDFTNREKLESEKIKVAEAYMESLLSKLRKAEEIGLLSLIIDILKSKHATVKVMLEPESYYTRNLSSLISKEFPDFWNLYHFEPLTIEDIKKGW